MAAIFTSDLLEEINESRVAVPSTDKGDRIHSHLLLFVQFAELLQDGVIVREIAIREEINHFRVLREGSLDRTDRIRWPGRNALKKIGGLVLALGRGGH